MDFPELSRERHVLIFVARTHAIDARELARFAAALSEEEAARAEKFLFFPNKRDYVIAHSLLREILAHYAGVPASDVSFVRNRFGKPALARDARLQFNLSHCDGGVAIAVGFDMRIGVDIEDASIARARYADIAAQYFSDIEQAAIHAAADGFARFIETWTLKEAYLKAIGLGLAKPLADCRFVWRDDRIVRFRDVTQADAHAHAWAFGAFAVDARYRVAVAVDASGGACSIELVRAGATGGARPLQASVVCRSPDLRFAHDACCV
ncbi:4-phosphopantetheinyl transferase [Burkholderia thailandensis]|uniref:4'-phosphopantetheinyl transferase superfamily protein n=1 Tax=Burkholderia thailandensis TaxID=57975 RepID=A0AAW9CQE8_BURTH|nr:4'-phosphopantetheinyl transferase superfamily protein [Burkholderia thailandensis]AHI67003.1 4'-phosphopantetheinyl transferase superfamily protein [Burkholderia thailandensis H0587]AIP65136.1 4-phosphopantetheinyl transferase [Burkholderia thailandensis]AOI55162.1 4-phosphopantetheinyl transferase [Burkholderia thailandensis]AOJ54193.1 4-phosphopantetheinyl transferase [Burkholderia thailandensis]AVR27650.1 4-phosphopantetheinyl transferase [Burkholderia thailandensis]